MEHPYSIHQTEILKHFMLFYKVCHVNMLFYAVCCAKMSTSGHLTFKNVYCFVTEQKRDRYLTWLPFIT